jgi:hypothetical protein
MVRSAMTEKEYRMMQRIVKFQSAASKNLDIIENLG